MTDYCMYCYTCYRFVAPLTLAGAIELSVKHTEVHQHTNVHAMKVTEMYPMLGEFKQYD